MLTNTHSVILGIIEGLTEFLPISSTGHLTLVSHLLGIVQNNQFIVFEISIQLGAILAVLFIYWKKFFEIKLLTKLFVAFLPTGILGLLIYKYIKTLLSSELIVAVSLVLGGIILIIVEKMYRKHQRQVTFVPEQANKNNINIITREINLKQAIILGLCQSLAMIPGVSRSGAVIVGGLLMRIERAVLVEFTFLLAVPTMSAATLYSLYKNKEILTANDLGNISIGFVTSFIVALVVIKFFLNYIKKYDFVPFGIYRIVIGLIVLVTFI